MHGKQISVLFDESGTPTIKDDLRTDWFLGVGVAYAKSDEETIFSECASLFGFRKSKPLKNDKLSSLRIVEVAKLLGALPLSIHVSSVDTTDTALRDSITKYEAFGNEVRRVVRGIRERPIAQIIHSQTLDDCLLHLIAGQLELAGAEASITVFIDDWSVPLSDIEIALVERSRHLIEAFDPFFPGCTIAPLSRLIEDSGKKRFIDVVASVISRGFLREDDQKYSTQVLSILAEKRRLQRSDATQSIVETMQNNILLATKLGIWDPSIQCTTHAIKGNDWSWPPERH